MASVFETKIEYIKGVGPQKAKILGKELGLFTYGDLIQYYPFRYEDRTRFYKLNEIRSDSSTLQIKGTIAHMGLVGPPRKQRLVAKFKDETGMTELVWFSGAKWIMSSLKVGPEYVIYGKPNIFRGSVSFPHPEIELFTPGSETKGYLHPVYHTTEILKRRFLDSKAISKIQRRVFEVIGNKIPETLPHHMLEHYGFMGKAQALGQIHFPKDQKNLDNATSRLKFEELFFVQLKLLGEREKRQASFPGMIFSEIPRVSEFYNNHLPFDLTGAQKRVIKEIRKDFASGKQMNRLLQGDVGSGKTIVAFICMLMAVDNNAQACLMAPTEILAHQHYQGLKEYAKALGLHIAILTGSTKKSERRILHEMLRSGDLHLLVGTHALLEDEVQFKNLGLCIIDEQHRFGVAQRARLWNKNKTIHPHILVMTATPIPRTLAMTVYGDLDVSVIDELPAGRKPIQTIHKFDSNRLRVFGFIGEEIKKGRQVYIVYPLIEESDTLDLKDLTDGYESVCRAFPDRHVSIVHGKMKSDVKDYEMQRFIKGETHIMVATTVIEVGVNVPNASVMVIENAERFGLAQLHQLRGRVGRGGEQSYCILMTGVKLSKEGKTRMETMVRTNNGFEIADVDLKLRGPGDLTGTQQSGVLDLLIADLATDGKILQEARAAAEKILDEDPQLALGKHSPLRAHISSLKKSTVNWGRIS